MTGTTQLLLGLKLVEYPALFSPFDRYQPVLAHLSANTYEQTNTMSSLADANNVESGVDVDASEFIDFTTALYNSWNSLKTNTITVQEYYCHSTCHGSCHSSRNRR